MTGIARVAAGAALVLIAASGVAVADDRAEVERAVLDYVEAIEQGRPELIERSVHPAMSKIGFGRQNAGEPYTAISMTYAGMLEMAGTFKKEGWIPKDATHSVEVFEVLDQTASAKLTAFWGIDYLHLAKYAGQWKIIQVLWQSPPDD